MKERKKTWEEKITCVQHSCSRCQNHNYFARNFYENLFFLNPKLKEYFKKTDMAHQEKALERGLEFLMKFFDEKDLNARQQILRISNSHSYKNLNIHPHSYYYWIEALVMTVKECDKDWYDDLEYYFREVISFPVTFMISRYYASEEES